jgi:hypothetical protein
VEIHQTLISCAGGTVSLPAKPMNHRNDGGHLLVNPPRPVWERSELTANELARWACLVAATGRAMLETLPQLAGGCLNYWEAGNNALNELAHPQGPKIPHLHRKMHLHVLEEARQRPIPTGSGASRRNFQNLLCQQPGQRSSVAWSQMSATPLERGSRSCW